MAKTPAVEKAKTAEGKTFKKVPDHEVVVFRDGKQHSVKPGKAFDFTGEEVVQILQARPDSLRDPINESSGDQTNLGSADQATLLREAQEQADAEERLRQEAQASTEQQPAPAKDEI
jgi:hypothetical protein